MSCLFNNNFDFRRHVASMTYRDEVRTMRERAMNTLEVWAFVDGIVAEQKELARLKYEATIEQIDREEATHNGQETKQP